ncbi:SDR family NAD(P)-dependent oxidoreductase [Paenibacillus koleovorans]|uniref:SDR family NAD(P)-dependent oxidoreductase n=1 Tax=Paenibacillus koleovorans TaxID=121608 RepID=UPI000FDC6AB4|nr:SDR family oxidoreductase [Paenibacillus koleovorans]
MNDEVGFDLTGKVALVIGAGETGVAIAQALGTAGAQLVLADSARGPLESAAEVLGSLGFKPDCRMADPSVKDQALWLVETIKVDYGKIDILVNAREHYVRGPAAEMGLDDWQKAVHINIKGVFYACQAVGKQMLLQGSGSIINLSSVAGMLGIAQTVAFAASKGSVDQLTRTLGVEWFPRGVRVNAIAAWNDGMREEDGPLRVMIEKSPAGRMTKPNELAGTAVYLASRASSSVTGQIVYVDGGYTAQ